MSLRRLALCAVALAAFAQLAFVGPAVSKSPAGLKLYAMDCGLFDVANADMFADDGSYKGQARQLVVPCYLIRHPKGDLVWDTGVPQETADLAGGKGPGGLTVKHKLTDQLKAL